MNDHKVSIIVPVYNVEEYVCECINSHINQSYKNIEIILVDDGSYDNSPAICMEYTAKEARIKVVHQKNTGVAGARNRGIQEAVGDYVIFCDSDDVLSPKFVEAMVACAEKYDFPICKLFKLHLDGTQEKCVDVNLKTDREYRPSKGIFSAYRGMYKRTILSKRSLQFTEGRKTGEDQEFALKYKMYCNSFAYVDDAIYIYRIIPSSVMHQASYAHFHTVNALMDTVKYAEEHGTAKQAIQYREDLLYYNAMRTIEFAVTTVLYGGEPANKVLQYIKDKGYDHLIREALKQPSHYSSMFYSLYKVSPQFCFATISSRKAIGRLLRHFKILIQ